MTIIFKHSPASKRKYDWFTTKVLQGWGVNLDEAKEVLLWCEKTFGPEDTTGNGDAWMYFMTANEVHNLRSVGSNWKKMPFAPEVSYKLIISIPHASEAMQFKLHWL